MFRLGRVDRQRGPGLVFLMPALDRMVRVSLRTVTLQIPAQEIITRDNIPARVTAVAYYRVSTPTKSVLEIENVHVRDVAGRPDDAALGPRQGRARLAAVRARDGSTSTCSTSSTTRPSPGASRSPPSRSRTSRSPSGCSTRSRGRPRPSASAARKIIAAEGEFQAAARLNDAAEVISRNPVTIQLRYLQTLIEVAGNQSSTIVFPLPIDILQAAGRLRAGRRATIGAGDEPTAQETCTRRFGRSGGASSRRLQRQRPRRRKRALQPRRTRPALTGRAAVTGC